MLSVILREVSYSKTYFASMYNAPRISRHTFRELLEKLFHTPLAEYDKFPLQHRT
jgi:hypothetical protein